MSARFAVTVATLLLAGVAHAAPALDYDAPDTCPDADRFADEVAARVGSVAFASTGEPFVVRLLASGDEITGTLEYGDGSKIVRSATCAEAFDGLVASAAVLLDTPSVLGAVAPGGLGVSSSGKARVEVLTDKSDLMVAQVDGRASGMGYGSAGSVSYQAVYYRDLCVAPCTAELDPGLVEIGVYGGPHRGTTDKFQLAAGETLTLRAEPGSKAVAITGATLELLGLTTAVTGASLWLAEGITGFRVLPPALAPGLTLGGLAGFGGGMGLMISSRGTLERVDDVQVSVGGTF